MCACSFLAVGNGGECGIESLEKRGVAWLEERIDTLQAELKPIEYFTIPGGCRVVSQCHICRTVCRRAERAVLRAAAEHKSDCGVQAYLNRLSDWFYLLGRLLTEYFEVCERLWIP